MGSLTKGLYRLGEVILYAIVSIFYSAILLLPIFLINMLLDRSIGTYVLLFVPLIALLGFALERQSLSFTATFVNNKKPLSSYFKEVFNKDAKSKYILYTILFALYYYGDTSLSVLSSASAIFGILEVVILYFYRGIIFFSILQVSQREYIGISSTIKNSLILTYKYFIYTIIVYAVWEIFERLMCTNIMWVLVFILIFAALINTINEYAIKNL